ncbi:Serine/threonine/tyrosine-interacting protein B [Orchesella cincta]|uniref:Serine/threonine/tyrosine-interacting protein B n=1 Tax=Orchesella cincta TaxID=48709 RepID=A0A1D2NJA0_ORCCI|nr:Serine/threonine/tyrosine-interacting protein B [Orchesella cincta]
MWRQPSEPMAIYNDRPMTTELRMRSSSIAMPAILRKHVSTVFTSHCTRADLYRNSSQELTMDVVDLDAEMGEPDPYPNLPVIEDADDWMYIMRRTMQEIVPNLFLGPYAAVTRASLERMKEAGLTHVVCVRSNSEARFIRANHPEHFQYLIVQMDDSPLDPIIPKVQTVSAFIDNCLKSGGRVLVHGNGGMSRSAALVIGYIMSHYGVTFKKAHYFVQHKRFCISISEAFANQLKEYEPIYKAMHDTPKLLPGESGDGFEVSAGVAKRKVDDVSREEEEDSTMKSDGNRPRLETNTMDTE